MNAFLKIMRRPAYADTLTGLCAFPFMLVFNNLLYTVLGGRRYLVTSYCKPEAEGAFFSGTNLLFFEVLAVKLILLRSLYFLYKKRGVTISWLPKLLFSVALVESISLIAYFYDLVFQTRTIAYFGASVYLYPIHLTDGYRGLYAIGIASVLLVLSYRLLLVTKDETKYSLNYLFLGVGGSTLLFIGAVEVLRNILLN